MGNLKIFNYEYSLRQSLLFFNLTRRADHPAHAYIYYSQSVKSRVDDTHWHHQQDSCTANWARTQC